MTKDNQTVVLSIAGSDSVGGAGIQADLKTFAAHGCYGTSALTALTAQNTMGVQGIHPCPPEFVEKQINSVLDDLDVRAIKTGMLYDAETAKTVVDTLKSRFSPSGIPPLVCDPVCVSTSGHTLLCEDALEILISKLFPLSTLITPNKSEAELLLSKMGSESLIKSLDDMLTAAEKLATVGCKAILLKGGQITARLEDVFAIENKYPDVKVIKQNIPGENMEILIADSPNYDTLDLVVDVLHQEDGQKTMFVRPRIESSSTHGTGCTLSSAIAAQLAKGTPLETAVEKAIVYTNAGIQTACAIGRGHGPLNHFHNLTDSFIPCRSANNPYPFTSLLVQSTKEVWKEYVEHDFVQQLGKGTLNQACFVHFVKQDYLYLKYDARAYGLLAAKSTSFPLIESSAMTIINALRDIGNHKVFCAKLGITEDELENTPESAATTAYGAYLLDTGLQGDTTQLMIALMACLLGYCEVGLWLKKQAAAPNSWVVLDGNPYQHWIDDCAGEACQAAVRTGLETIESCAEADPPSEARLNSWKKVWARCTKLEKGFWDMAMQLKD